jgi:hypothetical protein
VNDQWAIEPGTRMKRTAVHAIYGGAGRGGMEPSAKSPNVLLFTSPSVGVKHGYTFDGWDADGTYHYTGEGRVGDQVMKAGNRVTRDHLEEGRALRLFEIDGTDVIYMGEFAVPDDSHILVDEAPDSNGDQRKVFVFRLVPIGLSWKSPTSPAPVVVPDVQTIALEAFNVEQYITERRLVEPTVSLRSEAALVERYVATLSSAGASFGRHAIQTPAGRSMLTDIWIPERMELIEAKASSSRSHLRTALGQILDYARYVDHSRLSILVPTRPETDMESLLISHGVGVIWETEKRGTFDAHRVSDAWAPSD